MRGVFKTTDGGRSWQKVFIGSPLTGAIDLVDLSCRPEHALRRDVAARPAEMDDSRTEPGYAEGGIWKTTDAREDLERGERGAACRAIPAGLDSMSLH